MSKLVVTEEQARLALKVFDDASNELPNAFVNGTDTKVEQLRREQFHSAVIAVCFARQQLARIESERAAQAEFNARVERALNMLRGPRESYRPILTDRDSILARICSYAKRTAAGDDERRSVPVWSVISDITGHGSGVSSAIYELYRERDEEEVKANGGES